MIEIKKDLMRLTTILLNIALLIFFFGCSEIETPDKNALITSRNECCDLFPALHKVCESNKIDDCIKGCEDYLAGDFKNDNYLQLLIASAYYAKGETSKTIHYLLNSLSGEYHCDCISPEGNMLLIEKAMIHFCLELVYSEISDKKRASEENIKGVELLKKAFGSNYNEKHLSRIKKKGKQTLNFVSNSAGEK